MKIKIKLVNGYSFVGEIDERKAQRRFRGGKKLNYACNWWGCEKCTHKEQCQERALDYANRLADYYELIRA